MIRLRKYFSLFVLVFIGLTQADAQNLFDKEHSSQFAGYLLQSKQYDLASQELERVLFLDPSSLSVRKSLVFSYRMAGNFELGLRRLSDWYPNLNPDSLLAEEWIKLLLLDHSFESAESFLRGSQGLAPSKRAYYQLANYLLADQWDPINKILETEDPSTSPPEFAEFYQRKKALNQKSPGLALGLSAVVPGLGKVYAKDWKDGLVSLLFVATNAWQAYRGFNKDGIKSVYGWIFGTMAVGFYGSNLYGSWKSAQDYNLRLNSELHHAIEEAVFNRF